MKHFPTAFLILAVIVLGYLYVGNDKTQNKRLHNLEARPHTVMELHVPALPVISEREEKCLLHTVSIALATGPYENNSELFINDYRLCMGAVDKEKTE